MQFLKADTATAVLVGPAVAVGDGFTPVASLVGASADEYELIKYNGGSAITAAAPTNALSAISGADGYYSLILAVGDLDTEGPLSLVINDDSLILPIRHDFMVVNANVYDSLFAAASTDFLQVDTTQLGGATQSATDLKDFADAGYDPATNKVEGVKLVDTTTTNTDMVAAAPTVAQILDETLTSHVTADSVAVHLKDIVADTNELQGDDVPGLIAALNDAPAVSAATIADAVWDEDLVVGHAVADSAAVKVKAIEADTNELQTDDVPGLIAALNDAPAVSAATIADAVWDELQSAHTTVGSFGEMATEIANILVDTNELQTDDVPGLIAALNDLAGSDVLTQVNTAIDTAISELGVAAPTATPTLRTGLMLLYMMARNKLDVNTTASPDVLEVHNDAGTIITSKDLSDDGTDYSEAKMA